MVDLRRTCPECHRQFRPTRGTRRLYCVRCRPPKDRAPVDEPVVAVGPDIVGPLEETIRGQLVAAERESTVEGLVALSVARDVDGGRVSPTQKPLIGQRLAALVAAALVGTEAPVVDRLDEVSERRRARDAS
jgi:hypothetical protein